MSLALSSEPFDFPYNISPLYDEFNLNFLELGTIS